MTEKIPLSKPCSVAPREWRRTCSSDGEVTASWLAETADGRQQTSLTPMDAPPEVSAVEAGHRSRAAACRHRGSKRQKENGDFTEPTTRTNEPAATWQAAPG
jgi:hypothetical protein